jgi:hypothetical protein
MPRAPRPRRAPDGRSGVSREHGAGRPASTSRPEGLGGAASRPTRRRTVRCRRRPPGCRDALGIDRDDPVGDRLDRSAEILGVEGRHGLADRPPPPHGWLLRPGRRVGRRRGRWLPRAGVAGSRDGAGVGQHRRTESGRMGGRHSRTPRVWPAIGELMIGVYRERRGDRERWPAGRADRPRCTMSPGAGRWRPGHPNHRREIFP